MILSHPNLPNLLLKRCSAFYTDLGRLLHDGVYLWLHICFPQPPAPPWRQKSHLWVPAASCPPAKLFQEWLNITGLSSGDACLSDAECKVTPIPIPSLQKQCQAVEESCWSSDGHEGTFEKGFLKYDNNFTFCWTRHAWVVHCHVSEAHLGKGICDCHSSSTPFPPFSLDVPLKIPFKPICCGKSTCNPQALLVMRREQVKWLAFPLSNP